MGPVWFLRVRHDSMSDSVGKKIRSRIKELSNMQTHDEKLFYIRSELDGMGVEYEVVDIQNKYKRGSADKNIVVKIPGKREEELLFAAHWDVYAMGEGLKNIFRKKKKRVAGPGANDNGSGVSVLLESVKSDLESGKTPEYSHTYLFCGAGEGNNKGLRNGLLTGANISVGGKLLMEGTVGAFSPYTAAAFAATLPFSTMDRYQIGVCGSKDYVERLSRKERENIKAAVSIDMIGSGEFIIPKKSMGLKPTRWIVPYKMDPRVREKLRLSAIQNSARYSEDLGVGSSDHVSFADAGIPCGALLAIGKGVLKNIHSMKDTPDGLRKKKRNRAYKLISWALPPFYRDGTKFLPPKIRNDNLEKAFGIVENFKENFDKDARGQNPLDERALEDYSATRAEVFEGKRDGEKYLALRRCNPAIMRYINCVYKVNLRNDVDERYSRLLDVEGLVHADTQALIKDTLKDYKKQRYKRVLKDEEFTVHGLKIGGQDANVYWPMKRKRRAKSYAKKTLGRAGCALSSNSMPVTIGAAMGAAVAAGNAVPVVGPLTIPLTYAASAGAGFTAAMAVQRTVGTRIHAKNYERMLSGETEGFHCKNFFPQKYMPNHPTKNVGLKS